jgi:hypothetical protein
MCAGLCASGRRLWCWCPHALAAPSRRSPSEPEIADAVTAASQRFLHFSAPNRRRRQRQDLGLRHVDAN